MPHQLLRHVPAHPATSIHGQQKSPSSPAGPVALPCGSYDAVVDPFNGRHLLLETHPTSAASKAPRGSSAAAVVSFFDPVET